MEAPKQVTHLHWPGVVREYVGLAPDDGDAVGLRAERALEAKVLLVGAAELAQEVPQRRLAVPETLKFEMRLGLEDKNTVDIQSGASDRSLGFEDKNLGSSPGLLGQ